MNKLQEQVNEFMDAAEQRVSASVRTLNYEEKKFRLKLIREETAELAIALTQQDTVETADALADLLYVVIGTASACGIDIEPIFNEVHKSNMSKFIDGHMRDDGKWVKGPSFVPPNLLPILEQQGFKEQLKP